MTSRARTGCDLQSVEHVADAVRAFGARYLDRVYTPAEQTSLARGGPASLAARFAAKEAVLKLIGTADGVDLRSVEVTSAADGRPGVRLSGRAADLAHAAGVGPIDVSLSHTEGLALAVATAVLTDAAPASTTGSTTGSITARTTTPTTAPPTGEPASHD